MTILEEIQTERKRQDDKWGEQNHPALHPKAAHNLVSERSLIATICREKCDKLFSQDEGDWYLILQEEVAEAFEQAALGNEKEFREELIQTAAVVVAMIECLDRNGL